jgi:hypothetical protein
MRLIKLIFLGGLFVTSVIYFVCGKGSIGKLQSLHRKIGNDLIAIKKKYPGSQMEVYSLLDQMSKYYTFSKSSLLKKKKYKKLLKDEIAQNERLKNDDIETRKRLKKVKEAAIFVGRRLKQGFGKAKKLNEEKEFLSKELLALKSEKEKWIEEKNALIRERDELIRERDAIATEKGKKPSQPQRQDRRDDL